MKKSTLTFLGRDSGFGRENNSVYVEIDDKLVIIDCGFTVFEKLKEKLGIDVGQTTKDGRFSIEATRCIGACGLAPVFTVNDEVYGNATPELLDKVIDEYMLKE